MMSDVKRNVFSCIIQAGDIVIAVPDQSRPAYYHVLNHPNFKVRNSSLVSIQPLFPGLPFVLGRVLMKTPFQGAFLLDLEPLVLSK